MTGDPSSSIREGLTLNMNRTIFFFTFLFFMIGSMALAQNEPNNEKLDIYAIIKDSKDSVLEGYLSVQPNEVTVSSQENQEKKIPSKYLKSITLEKISEIGLEGLDPKQEARYSVRLQNSQEIYTLRKKYTFSLNTNVGVITRSIDPDLINSVISKDLSSIPKHESVEDDPLIQDKSIIFSLEFKF
jgi:hypothetical protein